MRHRLPALALTGALAASLIAMVPTPASANVTVNEVSAVPANGVFPLEGHGWGHGHGMSQYGARGGAQLGKTGDQITAFYYPNTLKGALGNVTMRVLLSADSDSRTEVYPASGLVVRDIASGASATLPTGPTRWRTYVDSAGLHLQSYSSGAWHAWSLPSRPNLAGPVQFSGPAIVRVAFPDGTSAAYRGAIRAVKLSATSAKTLDVLPMESYLRGVVPRESPSSWALEALKAQAIAARSYSEYERAHVASTAYYDICDTTACQVYGGQAHYDASSNRLYGEETSTDQAVHDTAGVIRSYNGAAIFAQFSSSNGGWTTDGGQPYLVAQRDDWDGVVSNNVHSWTASVTAAQIQARYPAVGTLLRMRVTSRDGNGEWGGRVKTVVLEGHDSTGAATSVSTTGAGIYNAHPWPASSDGLKSSWWHVVPAYAASVVTQSTAPRLVRSPGVSTGKLTVTMKNTGTSGWSTTGLHLTVASPVGQADPLVGGSTKPGVYTGPAGTIAPGGTADFSLALTGDGVTPGQYARSYRVRLGTGQVLGSVVSWSIRVDAAAFTATLVSVAPAAGSPAPTGEAPGPLLADGRTVVVPVAGSTSLTVGVRNTGNITWPVTAGGPVRLGTASPLNRVSDAAGPSWMSTSRPSSISASAPIAPGQSGTFSLPVFGNNKALGVTSEPFQPVWEHQSWITGADLGLKVVRVDPGQPRQATVDLAVPAKVSLVNAPNGTTVLVLRMRNVGGSSWPVGAERLTATATPLSTSAWVSGTQPPPLSRNVTRPTITAVYPGEVGEWRIPLSAAKKTPGSYGISFRLASPTGVTYGPSAATSIAVAAGTFTGTLVGQSAAVKVPRNGTATTWFDVKNTSNTTWGLGSSVRSESLVSGGSPSKASTWVTAGRPSAITANRTRAGATDVRPGEVARFSFALAGNGRTPRTTSEPFGVVWETWARISGLRVTLAYSVV